MATEQQTRPEQGHNADVEILSSLEERIRKAVELVAALRKENEGLTAKLEQAVAGREAAEKLAAKTGDTASVLRKEIETLQAERKQVRTRIEKLLGQMDLFGAS